MMSALNLQQQNRCQRVLVAGGLPTRRRPDTLAAQRACSTRRTTLVKEKGIDPSRDLGTHWNQGNKEGRKTTLSLPAILRQRCTGTTAVDESTVEGSIQNRASGSPAQKAAAPPAQ